MFCSSLAAVVATVIIASAIGQKENGVKPRLRRRLQGQDLWSTSNQQDFTMRQGAMVRQQEQNQGLFGQPQEYRAPQKTYGEPRAGYQGGYGQQQEQPPLGFSQMTQQQVTNGLQLQRFGPQTSDHGQGYGQQPQGFAQQQDQSGFGQQTFEQPLPQAGGNEEPAPQQNVQFPAQPQGGEQGTIPQGNGAPPVDSQGEENTKNCELTQPKEIEIIPTWTASFPGSGAKLFWHMIQYMTGIFTGDDNDTTGRMGKGFVVTVKTHFPTQHVSPKFFVLDTSKLKTAILLLRNPLEVVPSYFKFLYRMEEGNGPDAHVPVEKWIAWRNENFEETLNGWVEHTTWWIKNYGADQSKLHVVEFEKLVKEAHGPEELKKVGMFLATVDPKIGTTMVPENELHCVWERVMEETAPEQPKKTKKLPGISAGMPYPYTLDQLELMSQSLASLKRQFAKNKQVDAALKSYVKGVSIAKRTVQKLLGG